MNDRLQEALMAAADGVTAMLPQRRPSRAVLQGCRLVSHRGEHDNHSVYENTLPAFRRARDAGVWGIECDIHWTRDLVPVVIHDPDGARVFGDPGVVAELDFAGLRKRMPLVPSLEELVDEFGGNTHLMIEIKQAAYPDPLQQQDILAHTLAKLSAVEDYHFLALDPALFGHASFAPTASYLPVAELNVGELSELALVHHYGGLTGHYLLLGRHTVNAHHSFGQQIGTGHIGSRNALYRELTRGVEWLFSNHAVAMQGLVDRLLA